MKNLFILIISIAIAIGSLSNVSAATYEFYHVAVRDYDGDAVFNNGDVVRYGFTYNKADPTDTYPDTSGWYARAYDSGGTQIQQVNVGGGSHYQEAYGTGETAGTWSEVNYWKANFGVNGITSVKLFDSSHGLLESHKVNLPDNTQPLSSYNGFNPLSLSWEKQAYGVMLSWDGITPTDGSSYRLELSTPSWSHSIFQYLNGTEDSLYIPNSLFEPVGNIWNFGFQERFKNPLYATDGTSDNFNWLRTYSGNFQIDLSTSGSMIPTPIPGSILLLGSGIIGLLSFNRRKK